MVKALFFWATVSATISCAAQFVTVNSGLYGLIDIDGAPILNNEWDKVELISDDGNIYRYDRNGESGVYIHGKRLALPCRYTISILSDAAYSLCSNGKCGLLAGASTKNGVREYYWTGEIWDELYEINSRYAGVINESRYGVLSLNGTIGDTIVPIVSDFPIFRSHKLRFHSFDQNGNVILHAPGSSGKNDVTIATGNMEPRVHGNLVYFINSREDSLICIDYRNGRPLPSYRRDSQNGIMVKYDEDWHCIYRRTLIEKKTFLLELINPYSGEVMVSETVKGNTNLCFDADPLARDLDQNEIVMFCEYKRNRNIYTSIGELKEYEFTPYENRTVTVETFSTGGTKVPFFMPGRDK